jgi:glutamate carboxypeptidase
VSGPGVGDIKGGLVMGLYAMALLERAHPGSDIRMIISADEEIGSPGLRDWYQKGHTGAAFAIGLEPGFPQGDLEPAIPLGVVYQRRGYGAVRFSVTGLGTHSGTAHLGLNAIVAAAHRVLALAELEDREQGISINVGSIAGGTAANTVPSSVEGVVSFRYSRQSDGEAVLAEVERILLDRYIHNPEAGTWDCATITREAFIPTMERTDANMRMIDVVLEEAAALGQLVVPIPRGGGSDANWVSKSGTPAICGMGAPAYGIHTTDERVHFDMMLARIVLLARVLARFSGPTAS